MDELKSSCISDTAENRRNCIEAYFPYLLKHLEPSICKHIAFMLHSNIFTEDERLSIERCDDQNATREFLKTLLDHIDEPSCYSSFLTALNEFDMGYVVDTLEGKYSENYWIVKEWEQSLGENYHRFINEFKPKGLLMRYGRDLLGKHAYEEVKAQSTDSDMCHKLLHYLRKRPELFPKFIDALKQPSCGNLAKWAKLLDPEDNLYGMKFVNLIHAYYEKLMKDLEPGDILDALTNIPEASRDYVRSKKTREDRVKAFVSVLTTQPSGWFEFFIKALSECNRDYSKLVALLTSSDLPKSSISDENKVADEQTSNILTTTGRVTGGAATEDNLKSAFPSSLTTAVAAESGGAEDFTSTISNSAESSSANAFPRTNLSDELELNIPRTYESEVTGGPSEEDLKSTIPVPLDLPAQRSTNENLNNLDIIEKHEDEEKEGSEKKDTSSGKPSVELRSYQKELAEQALKGLNCMIVAPTGSGKTYVALHICLEHIKNTQNAKVVFLVPRVPLVQQQFNLFRRFLPDESNVIFQVTGESSGLVPVHISIRKHVVTVLTPQILVNLLNDEIMTIDEISLLIIDECHHTAKNDPYNMIMRVYLDEMLQGKRVPQVVGLTASPGMGKAKTMTKAHENIKTLMANLDVTTAPVQVNQTVDDLLQFQHEAQDEVIPVPRRENDPFSQGIKQAMKEIQKCIEDDICRMDNVLEGRITFDLRAAPGSQDYEAWAVNLLNKSKLIKHDVASQYFMAYAIHLREYNTALMLNDHVRSMDALTYISDNLFEREPRNAVESKMRQIYERNEPDEAALAHDTNPILDRLTLCLCKEFAKKGHSRCIIFVKTRAVAKALLTYLDVKEELRPHKLNPKQLTGAGARMDNFGMTKTGQEDTLKAFKEGTCKVLVATSVAEEGLDIKECNLIITYNYSTNEIGQVQRKGRGRAKDSKVIMLAYADSGHVKRERENSIRVELTQDILSDIRSMDPVQLKSQIRKIQETLKKDREFDRTVKMIKQKQKKPNDDVYKLSCIWCKRQVTTSDQLRHINHQHRVVTDVNFESRARFKEVPEGNEGKQIGDEQFVIGKIYCRNPECSREWGLRMRYKGWPISVPRIANFLLTSDKGYRAVKKQWKDAPFVVDKELTVEDLMRLAGDERLDLRKAQLQEDDDYDLQL